MMSNVYRLNLLLVIADVLEYILILYDEYLYYCIGIIDIFQ